METDENWPSVGCAVEILILKDRMDKYFGKKSQKQGYTAAAAENLATPT